MPFLSKAQQRFMFEKHPDIAKRWAKETPDFTKLPEHITPKEVTKHIVKKISKKKFKGKGGLTNSPFKQASSPINLLNTRGEPPVAGKIPNTMDNYSGNKLTK